MSKKNNISVFWFRRDLRLEDNVGLYHALKSGLPVIPIFIFDEDILSELPENDARVTFIYQSLHRIQSQLKKHNSSLLVKKGRVVEILHELMANYTIKKMFFNKDYEPYAIMRDNEVIDLLNTHNIETCIYKDQVIFEKHDILKADGKPYTVYTPYKNKWLSKLEPSHLRSTADLKPLFDNFHKYETLFPSMETIGFVKSKQKVLAPNLNAISEYHHTRDYPAVDGTSLVSPHLRFGTISIRKLAAIALKKNKTYLHELIWREFFMQILFHFPHVVTNNFKSAYNGIEWRDAPDDFQQWCEGNTGYPLVDAGMRQLNQTGYMHNRVRMITAGFLCKHLLLDWRLGEAYFAEKLLDYELSSNNGNWQWAAGTGCDAAPYFRVFNPTIQLNKFDKELKYVKKWIPNAETDYCLPMVEHKFARQRAIDTYKRGILKQ